MAHSTCSHTTHPALRTQYYLHPIPWYNVLERAIWLHGGTLGRLFLRWILLAFSVFAASMVSQAIGLGFKVKYQEVNDLIPLMIGVAILAFLNATLGKILKVLTLPLSCLTLGLFSLVVNAAVLMVAASLKLGFEITDTGFKGFLAALIASVIIAFINGVLGVFLPDDDKDDD